MEGPAERHHGYSARDVAALLGLSVSQIRSYVRSGLLSPAQGSGRGQVFSFQDLILLRTAKGLSDARVPPRRIQAALARLRQQLPDGQPLSGIRISARGQEVLARDGGETWHPESGQSLFDFAVAELTRMAATLPLAGRPQPVPPEESAEGAAQPEPDDPEACYELGWELEAEHPGEAIAAYRRAIELDPDHIDAHLNLGRLLHEEKELIEAEHLYRLVLVLRPGEATAAFDLGVVLQDLGRFEEAIESYGRAIALDPDLADAHYNLAGLLEALGQREPAFRHLRIYRTLTRVS